MSPPRDTRPILFFDIDNCLYPRSSRVQDLMQELIDGYFVRHLSLPAHDAMLLHRKYYTDYGLAISGLVKHHKIDPVAYNREVDDALPLDEVLSRDEGLRELLGGVDRRKVKLWLFTNAHITHARRVVRILGVEEFFEGITFCDYGKVPLLAKPHAEMFEKAEREAGALRGPRDCYFVDDSALNCRHAELRGWTVVHKLEEGVPEPVEKAASLRVRSLEELRGLFPQFFMQRKSVANGVHEVSGEKMSQL